MVFSCYECNLIRLSKDSPETVVYNLKRAEFVLTTGQTPTPDLQDHPQALYIWINSRIMKALAYNSLTI